MSTQDLQTEHAISDLKQLLLVQAQNDTVFRDRVIADEAIKLEDLNLPQGTKDHFPKRLNFTVNVDTAKRMHLVIPVVLNEGGPSGAREIIERAVKQKTFREKLKADPRKTLEEALMIELPEGVEFTVLVETATTKHLVLPFIEATTTRLDSAAVVYASSGWCGKTLNTVLINLCPATTVYGGPTCPVQKTLDPIDADCPFQTCSALSTYGL